MISPQIDAGKIVLGIEVLRCPRCQTPNRVLIHSDLPVEEYIECGACKYRARLDFRQLLKKYGLPQGLSKSERRTLSRHLQTNVSKI